MKLEPEKRKSARGQGMVEFALTIPIVLILMLGIIEFGRLLFVYTSITSAGREAARYGSAIGANESGTPYYDDCAGIKAAAMRIGQFAGVKEDNIKIYHDKGPSDVNPDPNKVEYCKTSAPGTVVFGQTDRIVVFIDILYTPISPLVNLPSFHLYSENAHSVLMGSDVVAKDVTTSGGGQVCDVSNFVVFSQSSPTGAADEIVIKNLGEYLRNVKLFPGATIFTLLHVRGSVDPEIESHEIRTSFVQRLPAAATRYRS